MARAAARLAARRAVPLAPYLTLAALALGPLAGLAGCSSASHSSTSAQFAGYVDHRLSEVTDRYGPPSANFDTGNGETVFQWNGLAGDAAPPQSGSRQCRVIVSAMPLYGDAPTTDYGNWVVKSVQAYGGCG
jgi:hypothetical protein